MFALIKVRLEMNLARYLIFSVCGIIVWWIFASPGGEAITLPDGSYQFPGYTVSNPEPFVLEEPILLSVEFFNSAMADHAMRMPEAERDGTCISLSLPDMVTAYNAFRALVALAAG